MVPLSIPVRLQTRTHTWKSNDYIRCPLTTPDHDDGKADNKDIIMIPDNAFT